MGNAIGLVELTSVPAGYETCDAMLKAANVELLKAQPCCPGKYLIVVSGQVGAVKAALSVGQAHTKQCVLCSAVDNLHEDVAAALKGPVHDVEVKALGSIETKTALAAILAADSVAKSASVRLLRVRMAQGIGGKGYVDFTGDIASVRNAIAATEHALSNNPHAIRASCAIAMPHPDLISHLR